jgi:hypothetical protein
VLPGPASSDVFASPVADGRLAADLVRRELIGAGELEALLRLALADAMFAMTAGTIDGYELDDQPQVCLLPLLPGADPDELLAEAARRLRVLESLPSPIAPDRDRVVFVQGGPTSGVVPGAGQAAILALANGRRTARDISFALGRGLYAVTLEIARMRGAGLVIIDSSTVRVPPYLGLSGPAGSAPGTAAGGAPGAHRVNGLAGHPRRRRGTGPPAAPPEPGRAAQPDRNALMRLLRAGVGIRRQARDDGSQTRST